LQAAKSAPSNLQKQNMSSQYASCQMHTHISSLAAASAPRPMLMGAKPTPRLQSVSSDKKVGFALSTATFIFPSHTAQHATKSRAGNCSAAGGNCRTQVKPKAPQGTSKYMMDSDISTFAATSHGGAQCHNAQ
jgi:hypothetical protein